MNRRVWRAVLAFAVALCGATLFAGPARATDPGLGPARASASFAKQSEWSTGYVGSFTVTNKTDSPLPWHLRFYLPSGTAIEHSWGARITRDGSHYVARGEQWNTTLSGGGKVTFGFITKGTGDPYGCLVYGAYCADDRPADIQPPRIAPAVNAVNNAGRTKLTWQAATDNVGVVGYEIYWNTNLIATVTGTEYTYVWPTVPPDVFPAPPPGGTTWRVRAFDAAGNKSAFVTRTLVPDPPSNPPVVP